MLPSSEVVKECIENFALRRTLSGLARRCYNTRMGFSQRPEEELVVRSARPVLLAANVERVSELCVGQDRAIDWPLLFDLAGRHSTIPQMCKHIRAIGTDRIPPTARDILIERSEGSRVRSLHQVTELIGIVQTLESHGIEALAFKGQALAAQAYGGTARIANDHDFLVRRSDVVRIIELFRSKGYRVVEPLSLSGLESLFENGSEAILKSDSENVQVEFHWHLDARRYRIRIATEDLFRRSVTVRIAGRLVRTFSPEDMLIFLCWHGAKHYWRPIRLIADVSAFVDSQQALDWDAVFARCATSRLSPSVAIAFALCRNVMRAELPEEALKRIPVTKQAERAAARIASETFSEHCWIDREWDFVKFLSLARTQAELRSGWSAKSEVVASLALTPTPLDVSLAPGGVMRLHASRSRRLIEKYLLRRWDSARQPT